MAMIVSFTRLRESTCLGASLLRFAWAFTLALPAGANVSPSATVLLCMHAECLMASELESLRVNYVS